MEGIISGIENIIEEIVTVVKEMDKPKKFLTQNIKKLGHYEKIKPKNNENRRKDTIPS